MRRRAGRTFLRHALPPLLAVLSAAGPAIADEPLPPAAASPGRDHDAPDPDRDFVTYLRAAANVGVVNYAVWQIDWLMQSDSVYLVTGRDIGRNHLSGVTFDEDTLNANFCGHTYAGALTFGAARATGLSFWESAPFVLGGSVMWEFLGESQRASANDLITTSFAGIGIGEILYRLSSLALDDSGSGFRRARREALAFAIDPPRGANRLATGEAWQDDAPPVAKPARIVVHGGIDHLGAGSVRDDVSYRPSAIVAVDVEYGNLLPAPSRTTIPAYDFFDFHASAVISTQSTSGFQLSALGLLQGWSSAPSNDDEGPYRNNNVVGIVQSFDYQGNEAIDFGALGLGVGDFFVVREAHRKRLRLSGDARWVPLAASSSKVNPYVGTEIVRDYGFSMGASVGLGVRWDIGRVGQLGLSAREYATAVVDGIPGRELFGYARLWYEVDAFTDRLGVGVATKAMHRLGRYSRGREDDATQLTLELYATIPL